MNEEKYEEIISSLLEQSPENFRLLRIKKILQINENLTLDDKEYVENLAFTIFPRNHKEKIPDNIKLITNKDNYLGSLDFPKHNDTVYNPCKVSGWTFSTIGKIVHVKFFIDNHLAVKSSATMPRFDVEKRFLNYENSYNSGFLFNYNLKNFKDGPHTLSVVLDSVEEEPILLTKIGFTSLNKKDLLRNIFFDNKLNTHYSVDKHVFETSKEFCYIKPNSKVLEIGCQYGRTTMPFTEFLDNKGEFFGIDIVPDMIDYCKNHISAKYSNFKFFVADIYNKWYNPKGKEKSTNFKFPFESEYFDFIFLVSVFTHMLPDDLENYLTEISRMLKKDGYCLITYLLFNESVLENTSSNNIMKKYIFDYGIYRTKNEHYPEAEIVYDESWIKNLYEKNQINIKSIIYGQISDPSSKFPQDMIIGKKLSKKLTFDTNY